ncbi:MAG TPA: ABC transporter substrate-binding protein [Nitrospira sp.]|nr:ABC transporter substrate-binding protein [Nitrospira sp.]
MRICSLLPGATEVVAALGLADSLVGISHECDYPAAIRGVPVLVQPAVDSESADSAGIDRQVKALTSSGQPLYRLNDAAFAEARPDIILTQELCHVCAVTPHELERAMRSLPQRPEVLTLAPRSLADVIDDVERIAAAVGAASKGRDLADVLRSRTAAVRDGRLRQPRPRVVCLEWLSPLYVGGHWIPEMVDAAGGQDVLGQPAQPSRQVTLEEVRAARPDIVIIMPCGFSVARTVSELSALCRADLASSELLRSAATTVVVDAGSYFSRPGPRLVDGVELMADICAGTMPSGRADHAVRDLTGSVCLTGQPL